MLKKLKRAIVAFFTRPMQFADVGMLIRAFRGKRADPPDFAATRLFQRAALLEPEPSNVEMTEVPADTLPAELQEALGLREAALYPESRQTQQRIR